MRSALLGQKVARSKGREIKRKGKRKDQEVDGIEI
jgi:hypothetical protein